MTGGEFFRIINGGTVSGVRRQQHCLSLGGVSCPICLKCEWMTLPLAKCQGRLLHFFIIRKQHSP